MQWQCLFELPIWVSIVVAFPMQHTRPPGAPGLAGLAVLTLGAREGPHLPVGVARRDGDGDAVAVGRALCCPGYRCPEFGGSPPVVAPLTCTPRPWCLVLAADARNRIP